MGDAENAEGVRRGRRPFAIARKVRSCLFYKVAVRSERTRSASIRRCTRPVSSSDWIIGTSIGAINAALIAGSTPERRIDALQEFWRGMRSDRVWYYLPAWTGTPGRDVVPNDTVRRDFQLFPSQRRGVPGPARSG